MAIPPRSGMHTPFDYPADEPLATEPRRSEKTPRDEDKQPVGAILLGALAALAVIIAALVVLA